MPDALTTITTLIQSPPGQLAAGGVLAGIVWKFFERVEAVLKDDTKLEIAVWLLGVKVGQKVEPWPGTFAKVFDRVFGTKHLSWKCFWRSAVASIVSSLLALTLVVRPTEWGHGPTVWVLTFIVFSNVFPDYLSLLETRALLAILKRRSGFLPSFILIVVDLCFTIVIAEQGAVLAINILITKFKRMPAESWYVFMHPAFIVQSVNSGHLWFLVYPAFFTSIWLWLYAGSGFILKAARRFDVGFAWFNRRFDIEKRPLQSIGLVAGALVAVVYWAAVIVGRLV
jgi:hypothetical protein